MKFLKEFDEMMEGGGYIAEVRDAERCR